MDLGLSGTRVLVAGASQGIGQGIAEALLEEGAKVLLTGRSPGPLQVAFEAFAAQHGDRVAQHAADMTATDGITGAFAAMEAVVVIPTSESIAAMPSEKGVTTVTPSD